MATGRLTVGRLNIIDRPMVKEALQEARRIGVKFSPIQFERKKAAVRKAANDSNMNQQRLFS